MCLRADPSMASPPRAAARRSGARLPALAALCLFLVTTVSGAASANDSALNLLRERMAAEYRVPRQDPQAGKWIASLQPDGRWPDIDYADKDPSTWKPLQHLDRLLGILGPCTAEDLSATGREACSSVLERGVKRWVLDPPQSSNWWNNDIGAPLKLARILVLGDNFLQPATRKAGAALLYDGRPKAPSIMTGQNLVWFSELQMVKGIVIERPQLVAEASRRVQSTLDESPDEGWQVDQSFHQHGAQLYNGGYGLLLVLDAAKVATWLKDTPWAFSEPRLASLADHVLDGTRWMTAGPCWTDYSTRGREFTRLGAACGTSPLPLALERLADLVPARRQELEAFARIQAKPEAAERFAPTGVKAFWRSDFLVQRTAAGYASIRIASKRTIGAESMNGENLLGYWLPFGTTWYLNAGRQPVTPALLDWSRLPGVTAGDAVLPFQGTLTPSNAFAGVLADQGLGLAAFQQNAAGVVARKAWFTVGPAVIALGAGIRGAAALHTGIDQTQLQSEVLLDGKPSDDRQRLIQGEPTLWHAGTGYVVLAPSRLLLTVDERKRQRASINTAVRDEAFSAKMFTLSLEHQSPMGSYAYAVLPGASKEQTRQWRQDAGWRVASNTEAVQAVQDVAGRRLLAVFHQAGVLKLEGGLAVRVDGPALLSVSRESDANWSVTGVDPLQTARQVQVELSLPGGRTQSRIIDFPQGAEVGRASSRRPLS
jgi:chondroitin AC lyase